MTTLWHLLTGFFVGVILTITWLVWYFRDVFK